MKWRDFWRGFKVVLPFWIGAAPFALTYVLASRGAGLGTAEIVGMSLLLDSAATQMSLVQMIGADTPAVIILLTVAAMNVHLLLYGVSLAKCIALSPLQQFAAAFPLTDGAYGVTMTAKDGANFAFLFGAGMSIYAAWNLFTLVGCAVGDSLVAFVGADLDFVIPLTFSMLLVSAIKTRPDLAAALIATLITVVCVPLGSLTILIVSISGLIFGMGWSKYQERKQA